MKLSKVHKFMLFTLGHWYEEASRRVKNPLHIAIKKVDFIKILKKGQFADKGPRAVYKNLETLEKNKYISYENKDLHITDKGIKEYNKIKLEVLPYIHVVDLIRTKDPLSYGKRVQTRF